MSSHGDQCRDMPNSAPFPSPTDLVAGKREGDAPDSSPDPAARRRVLRFEVAAETFALFRQALAELRRRSGAGMDDDAALLEMARQILGGPSDDGRASYQIALTVCAECGATSQEAHGELVQVGPEIAAMAGCDGQHLGRVHVQPANDASGVVIEAGTPIQTVRVRAHVSEQKQDLSRTLPRSVPIRAHCRAAQVRPHEIIRARCYDASSCSPMPIAAR